MNINQLTVITTAFLVATQADGNGVNFKTFGTLGLVYSDNDGTGCVYS